jgi:hypothetical protein
VFLKNKLRLELEHELVKEEQKLQEAGKKFKKLEKEEMDVINRIKTTTEINSISKLLI